MYPELLGGAPPPREGLSSTRGQPDPPPADGDRQFGVTLVSSGHAVKATRLLPIRPPKQSSLSNMVRVGLT